MLPVQKQNDIFMAYANLANAEAAHRINSPAVLSSKFSWKNIKVWIDNIEANICMIGNTRFSVEGFA